MTRTLITALTLAASIATSALAATDSTRVDSVDANGNTPLMVAAALGQTDVVATLIDDKADVNARGRIGNTALIYAVQEGHTDIVQILIEAGARVNVQNEYGNNPRDLAIGYGKRDIVEILSTIPAGELESPARLLASVTE